LSKGVVQSGLSGGKGLSSVYVILEQLHLFRGHLQYANCDCGKKRNGKDRYEKDRTMVFSLAFHEYKALKA